MDNCKKKLLDFAVHNIDYWKEGFSHLRTKIEHSDENSLYFANNEDEEQWFVDYFRNNKGEHQGFWVRPSCRIKYEKVDSLFFEYEEPTLISREEWMEERIKVLNHEMKQLKRKLEAITHYLIYS